MTEEKMREALEETLEWIRNWDPPFTQDPEWPATSAKIDAALSTKQEAGEVERARRSYSIGFEEAKGDAANKVSAMARDFKNHGSIDRLEPFTEIALAIRAIPCPETATQEAGEVSHSQTAQVLERLADAADAVGVQFFDTDTMAPEVEEMQAATQAARVALSLPAPDGSSAAGAAPLPCDVMVAPATIIRKGCSLSTLLLAISRREGQPTELVTWNTHPGHPLPAPPVGDGSS